MDKINNKEFTLCDFMNNMHKLEESHDSWNIIKVLNRSELNKDEKFLKWETSSHDSDEGICPKNCYNCQIPDDEDYECIKIELNYYVEQWTVGMEVDSYQGTLVYPLKEHFVFVEYSC